jgi:hypothetical protein
MPPQQPPDRKKRIIIALVGAAIALTFIGNFFWSFFKDFYRQQPNGGHGSNVPLFIFGGFFVVMALAVVFSVVRGIRKLSKPDSAVPRDEKPWLKRADWAAGKIKSTAIVPVKILVIFALAFGGFGGFMTFFVLPKEWHNGNYNALIVLLFPAVGIGFIIALVRRLRAQRRFGDCFFELAQIPAPLGGTLEGQIQVGTRLRLEHGLHLKLSCVRITVSGSGEHQSRQENILWQDEKVFAPNADLPEAEPGRSGIPVFFKLPADQPECYARGNEAVVWRLEAKAKMSDPDFCARFDVPVFKIADAVAADADESDPTAVLQAPIEEIRRDEHSKIIVTDGPSGREFYFPAARNLGTALFTTLLMLIFNGIAIVTFHLHAPILFPMAFGLFGVLLLWGTSSMWFKSSRVTIDSTNVRVTNRWWIFSRTRQFFSSDVERFATKAGMQSGSQIFTDIKLIKRGDNNRFEQPDEKSQEPQQLDRMLAARFRAAAGPSGVTVAGSIANVVEANWLVAEMNKALGRES